MTVRGREDGRIESHAIYLLRLIVGILLFPILWICVTVGIFGIADRFSFVPGVSKEGGAVSGVVALILTAVILGILVGAISVATGGGIPLIGGGDDGPSDVGTSTPSPSMTPTPTPESNQNATTTTPAASPTETVESSDKERFNLYIKSRLDYTMKNDTLAGVPPLALQYREKHNGSKELWLVFRQCDTVEGTRSQLVTIGNVYANAVGSFDERQADRLVVYGINKLETYNDSISAIPSSSAAAAYNGTVDPGDYTENWTNGLRSPNQSESKIAFRMTTNESGRTKAEQAFHEHYSLEESDRDCPGTAAGGSDESSTGQRDIRSVTTIAAKPVLP